MSRFTMTIGGEAVLSDASVPVVNPALGSAFAECPDASRGQLDNAMDAAQKALPSWRRDEAKRREALLACAQALQANADALGETLCLEQGKPLAAAKGEVLGSAFWFQATAGLPIPTDVISDTDAEYVELRRRPLGVVGAITPWNFPVILAVWKIAPALLTGNTMVLKPSPYTPLSTLQLGEVLRDVLPPGVLNVVAGGDGLGAWITEHPIPRKISFTGSVATGKRIMAAAAQDLKRVTLELGGNDPAIVLKDVDPEATAQKLFASAFENCGQLCVAIKRVYVEEEIHAPLVEALAERARALKVGPGMEEGSEMGPVNNRPQYERVLELMEAARQDGARFAAGGEPLPGDGYFIAPSIATELSDGSRLVDEEQFGPVLPVVPVSNAEDAIERANRTHFGLGGSVWTGDRERGVEIAGELECGTAWVNRHGAMSPYAPFGGFKWSGIGRENGTWGLEEFTELQVVNVEKGD